MTLFLLYLFLITDCKTIALFKTEIETERTGEEGKRKEEEKGKIIEQLEI